MIATTNTNPKWVLIVEDDAFIDKAYAAKFAHEGIIATIVSDGEAALSMLREKLTTAQLPSLILLDLMLPKKNGFEVLEELHKDEKLKTIPVIILTNLGQEADAKRGLALGAVEYLVKADTKINDIIAHVRAYI